MKESQVDWVFQQPTRCNMRTKIAVGTGIIALVLGFAAPSFAHIPAAQPSCTGLTVKADDYPQGFTLSGTIDGSPVHIGFNAWSQTQDHVWAVKITAPDWPEYDNGGTQKACQTAPSSTATSPSTTSPTLPPTSTVSVTTVPSETIPTSSVATTSTTPSPGVVVSPASTLGTDASTSLLAVDVPPAPPAGPPSLCTAGMQPSNDDGTCTQHDNSHDTNPPSAPCTVCGLPVTGGADLHDKLCGAGLFILCGAALILAARRKTVKP